MVGHGQCAFITHRLNSVLDAWLRLDSGQSAVIRNIYVMGKISGHKKGTKREKRHFLSSLPVSTQKVVWGCSSKGKE